MSFLDKAKGLLARIGKAFAVDLTPEVARDLIADYLKNATVEDLVAYVESGESVFEKVWNGMREETRKKIVNVLSHFKEVREKITPKTVLEALVEVERYDLLSVFVNSRKAREWLAREVETAKKHLWPENVKA